MGLLKEIFGIIASSKWNQDRLLNEDVQRLYYSPYLLSSETLRQIMARCKTKEEYDAILDHLYRFDCTTITLTNEEGEEYEDIVESYHEIEWKIINMRWKG